MYCDKCHVTLIGRHDRCPLCRNSLTGSGDESENVFPKLPIKNHLRIFVSWATYFSLLAVALSFTINIIFPAGGSWWIMAAAGIGTLWLSFMTAVKKRGNLPKAILWQVALVSLLSFAWDYFTGFHLWSINFVIPIFASCAMAAMALISKILKLSIQDFMLYLIIDSIIGFISFGLIILTVPTVVFPSIICFMCSCLSIAALVILEGNALWAEIQRRLHI